MDPAILINLTDVILRHLFPNIPVASAVCDIWIFIILSGTGWNKSFEKAIFKRKLEYLHIKGI